MNDDEYKSSVARAQSALRRLHLNGENVPEIFVDGIFESETTEAVKSFQNIVGLEPTGEIDFETWTALIEREKLYTLEPKTIAPFISNKISAAMPGERKPPVYFAQAMLLLASAEYSDFDGIIINGINDGTTLDAIQRVQEKNDLKSKDGTLDMETWNAIAHLYECCK